jgi:hypothetical protein
MFKEAMKKFGLREHEDEGTTILQNNTVSLPEDLNIQF